MAGAECVRNQSIPLDVSGPRLGERARQREQHRPTREWAPGRAGAQTTTAGVDYQRARGKERFDLVDAQRLLEARTDAPGGGKIERSERLAYLGEQGGHACAFGCSVRAGE